MNESPAEVRHWEQEIIALKTQVNALDEVKRYLEDRAEGHMAYISKLEHKLREARKVIVAMREAFEKFDGAKSLINFIETSDPIS